MTRLLVVALMVLPALAGAQVSPEQAEAWYERAAEWAIKPGVTAVVIGVIVAFIVPQRVKLDFPLHWPDDHRRRMTRLTSFICGFVTTGALWPIGWNWKALAVDLVNFYMVMVGGFFAAILVGATAPFTYTIIVGQLSKRGWWTPTSGEEHAELKRTGTGSG